MAYVHRNDGSDMRVSKECNSLLAAGYEVHFIGWTESKDPTGRDIMPGVTKHLYFLGGPGRRRKWSSAAGFVLYTFRQLRRLRPDIVHAVNEETIGLVAVLKPWLRFRLAGDLFDSLVLRHSDAPFPKRTAIRIIGAAAQAAADVLIVTDERRRARLSRWSDSTVVVENYPLDPGDAIEDVQPPVDGPLILYVAGSLSKGRGLEAITALLDRRQDVRVISAGWVYDEMASRFVEHPHVEFLGVLTPEESLHQAAACHAVVALYEPSSENNILASPNKVYDALCIGRPIIINVEARVSEWVAEHGVGKVVRYGSVTDLARAADQLAATRAELDGTSRRLRQIFRNGRSWEVAERRLLKMYEGLVRTPADPGARA